MHLALQFRADASAVDTILEQDVIDIFKGTFKWSYLIER
jgi:hypothetical protein